jgi:hypothetical protein
MAGSIKIQHGGTASTPQAGFSTLWVRSSDGQFYYTKPNGSSEPLVGATGATGIGLGLNSKSGSQGGTAGWIPNGGLYYYDVVFDQPFSNTNYTAAASWSYDYPTNSLQSGNFTDLSTTGFRININGSGSASANAKVQWSAIANGESAVLQTKINPIPPTYATVAAAAAAGLTGGDLFKTSAGMLGVVF